VVRATWSLKSGSIVPFCRHSLRGWPHEVSLMGRAARAADAEGDDFGAFSTGIPPVGLWFLSGAFAP
jgi:hypothetical protein